MKLYFLYKSNKEHVLKYKFIFNRTYGLNTSDIYLISDFYKINISLNDLIICFDLEEMSKMKSLSNHVRKKGAKFGIFFGDSLQYFDDIYSQFIHLVDFCFTHELSESGFYESRGLPSFDHPIFQPHSIFISFLEQQENYKCISNRKIFFVHHGLIDNKRQGRKEMLKSLISSGFSYKIYGKNKGYGEYIDTNELPLRLSNSIFGILPCSASSSTPLSKKSEGIKYQFKGKIWEYMAAGCIPVLDYAPNLHRLGLIDGLHYISVNSFNKNEIDRIANIRKNKLQIMSNNILEISRKFLSNQNFRDDFDVFYNNLINNKYKNKSVYSVIKNKKLKIACLEYTILRKKLSWNQIISGFYIIKIFNFLYYKFFRY